VSRDAYRRVGIDRPGAAGLSSVGLGVPGAAPALAVLDAERRGSEARFALSVLAGALGGVYVVAGLTLVGRIASMGIALSAIGLSQGAWAAWARQSRHRACALGALLNAVLIAVWLSSRTVGLSLGGGGRQPIGVLDTLCAIDSALIVLLAGSAARRSPPRFFARRSTSLSELAVLLAVLTVSALLGGHTHTAQAAQPGWSHGSHVHLYCRLL